MKKTNDPKILLRRFAAFAIVAVGFVGFKLAQDEPVSVKQQEVATAATPVPRPSPAAAAATPEVIEQSTVEATAISTPPADSGAIEFKPGAENQGRVRYALLPQKAKKQAILWALDYMDRIMDKILEDPFSINPSSRAIRLDVQKAADKHYPNSQELNTLWFEYALEEIGSEGENMKYAFEENMSVEDAFTQIRQERKERREQVSRPGFERG